MKVKIVLSSIFCLMFLSGCYGYYDQRGNYHPPPPEASFGAGLLTGAAAGFIANELLDDHHHPKYPCYNCRPLPRYYPRPYRYRKPAVHHHHYYSKKRPCYVTGEWRTNRYGERYWHQYSRPREIPCR